METKYNTENETYVRHDYMSSEVTATLNIENIAIYSR
jgi:hypothetical protein